MTIYNNSKRPRLTLKERLIKNKQYLKRRLLRISKRANWLKRKLSKRLKHVIKSRRVRAFYFTNNGKIKTFYKCTKVKKFTNKTKQKDSKQFKVQNKLPVKMNQFNSAKVAKKILNMQSKVTFKYFN